MIGKLCAIFCFEILCVNVLLLSCISSLKVSTNLSEIGTNKKIPVCKEQCNFRIIPSSVATHRTPAPPPAFFFPIFEKDNIFQIQAHEDVYMMSLAPFTAATIRQCVASNSINLSNSRDFSVSNHIFWVGIGWCKGHLAQKGNMQIRD